MIREAMQYLIDLAEEHNKVLETKINGSIYTERNLKRIDEYFPQCDCMELKNLNALIQNIRTNLQKDYHNLPLILNVSENQIDVWSSYDQNKNREHIFRTKAQVPTIDFNHYMSVENMIIQLQTCFLESENKSNLIGLISRLSKKQEISLEDDGITQRVTATEGVATVAQVSIPPLVKLTPQRTFYEVIQPEQLFLFRVDKNCNVALFDAAGGAWKYLCQLSIIDYLKFELTKEIEDGKVIIG